MSDFPFSANPDDTRSDILSVCEAERERQWRTLIMIPSESICHPAAAAVLASDLGNIYAEGRPDPIFLHNPRESASDEARFQSWQTRMADHRFYKGTVHANRAELLAQRRIAEVFARLPGSPSAGEIHVNVQPLSGAVANLSVFAALLQPGDRIMGLDLGNGGHLTHGSRFNVSGKIYEAHAYGIDPTSRRIDYDRLQAQARTARPRLIIGGASSYPWDFDWATMRHIADEVGAYLLADIAHLSGMIAGGVLQNPVPYAHAVMFTTHKTLCGPRGAAILSLDPEIARKIDAAVFPGLQGGPHMNSIAAIARLFELIQEDYAGFCALQRRIVTNAAYFAECLKKEGLPLEYGGTNTHMVLTDLKKFPVKGEAPLDGEIASRLLEIAGIVCNKNVLPGDVDAGHASGLRFGLPWLTQRGVTEAQIAEIARLVRTVLQQAQTFAVWTPMGDQRCRGRVPAGVLAAAARQTLAIAEALPYPSRPARQTTQKRPARVGDRVALLVRGDKVTLALDQMLSVRLPAGNAPVHARMLEAGGQMIDDVIAVRLDSCGREERWLVLPHEARAGAVRQRIEELSDGYLLFDTADPRRKVDGPMVVEGAEAGELPAGLSGEVTRMSGEPKPDPSKPYFIGSGAAVTATSKKIYVYHPAEAPLRKTLLNAAHHALGAKMAPFAGWEMPIQYPTGILAEHRAVRTAAGLFDVSHMSALEVTGPHALGFLEAVLTNSVSRLDPGDAQYSSMLYPDGTHVDDLYVYRMTPERYMLVVNAANSARVKDWLAAVNSHQFVIDLADPTKEADGPVAIRDLRDAGEDSRVQLAFQGPASLAVMQGLADSAAERDCLQRLPFNAHAQVTLAGIPTLVTHTGYTGEKIGYELFAHPRQFENLWKAILEAGKPLGVLPTGLGARDSARIEAGLPLFGHEIEGGLGIGIAEAGYGFVMRFHKPYFIGRPAYRERMERSRRHLLRLRGQGRKTLRPGHVILDASGKIAGEVTSFAYAHTNMEYLVLACVREDFLPPAGAVIRGARLTAEKFSEPVDETSVVELTVMLRFPDEAERMLWRAKYQ